MVHQMAVYLVATDGRVAADGSGDTFVADDDEELALEQRLKWSL